MSNEFILGLLGVDKYESEKEADDILLQLFGRSPRGIPSTVSDGRRTVVGDDFGYYTSARARQLVRERGNDPRLGIALELPAGHDWAFTAYATLYLGLTIVPVDPRWPEERRRVALDSCAVHVTPDSVRPPIGVQREWVDPRPLDLDVPALELQTSGSSGVPTRVVHSRRSLAAQAILGARVMRLDLYSHWLSALPMTHAAGIGVFIRSLAGGGSMTLLPHFVEDEFLARLAAPDRQPPVSVVSLVPTMLTRLLDAGWVRPEGLEAAVIGGAPLGAELRVRAIEAGIPIRESWGMTETLGMISVARTDTYSGVGQPLPGVEVRASDAGELLVRGPIVAPGLSDEEGWFHTNDSGYVDERGFIHVEGRVGSMIISGGENVFPEAVERALLATGLLEDVLVSGEADPEWGQRVVADAVPKLPTTTPSEVRDAVIDQLARWELPKEITFVEQIKRDKLGKVVRHSNG